MQEGADYNVGINSEHINPSASPPLSDSLSSQQASMEGGSTISEEKNT